MKCKVCGKEIKEKFYRHLNSSHKMKKSKYLDMFPDQKEEYKKQVPDIWCKGKTKENNKTLELISKKVKKYSNQEHVKKERSRRLKEAYRINGDIVSPSERRVIAKIGSDAWVKKLKSCSFEERKKLLKPFTTAGNKKQEELRVDRTPADYQRLYPFAKGKAKYGNCEFCKKQIIIWVGGKPRPKIRFCSKKCNTEYQRIHPYYTFKNTGRPYNSTKMNCEFFLRSKLELWFSELLDSCFYVKSWFVNPYSIPYYYEDKKRIYHPDFLINEKFLIELKSGYIYEINAKRSEAKLKAGNKYCKSNNLTFCYWQFNDPNMSRNKFCKDERVFNFFESLK